MRASLSSIVVVGLFCSLPVAVQAGGDAAAGQAKAAACEACHGAASANPLAPKLAGQPAGYTTQQLVAFRGGARKDPVMQGLVAALTDADVADIAAYYAGQPYSSPTAPVGVKAPMIAGYFQNKCGMCHGDLGTGAGAAKGDAFGGMLGGSTTESAKEVPLLAGQPEAYLAKALQDYRSGVRKSKKAFVMDIVARDMTDSQIASVAKYLSGTSGAGRPDAALAKRD